MTLGGCSDGSSPPATTPVSGTVSYKGQPLGKGTVTFQPADKGEGVQRPALGEIGADGRYQLSTFTQGDGALPGNYHVLVTSFVSDPTAEEYAEGAKRESAIPEKYSNALTSGMTKEVPSGSSGINYDIELTE